MNKVILMGRLTKDPEVHYSQSETPTKVVTYILAVRNNYSKNRESNTDFINIVAFGKQGEFADKYMKKGNMINVSGRLHQNRWEDAEHIKHSKYEVIVEEQQFVEKNNLKKEEAEIQTSANQVAISNEDLSY